MSDWLVELDNKMKKQKRKIILFMDNATSHPDDLKLKNINLVFLPPNTTSMLQPLGQGIICSFKVGYRKLLLRHVLSQISSCKSSEELTKSVSVLDAISWTTSALKKVEPGCVLKYFKKAGFLSKSELATVSTTEKREKELADLVANFDSNVSVEKYVKIDDDLSIEEENLHVSNFIHRDTTEALALSEDGDEESPMEECKIKDYSEALKYSE
ncbi:Tigger transposable element-derived protein 4 [Araneus ventricosus]|uniref:Tigger transposable element-derived protein 4 n=1 Tax=Araneus ventricosus TaxID=182803 RepID=A0A4Y2DN07_ARAVE|nr:Tigger transposable element-derived protein 4 [Araneus ventricosus]